MVPDGGEGRRGGGVEAMLYYYIIVLYVRRGCYYDNKSLINIRRAHCSCSIFIIIIVGSSGSLPAQKTKTS